MQILHLTDVHVSADRNATLFGCKPWETWHQVWTDIQQKYDISQFDCLILSGDLSHDDSELSYHHLAKNLASFPGKVLYSPGNHDDYTMMQRVFMQAGLSSERLHIFNDWGVIGLNSQVPGNVHGELAQTELAWLENCLTQYANKKFVIFLHHHVLKIQSFWLDWIGLKNHPALLNIIDAHSNVRVVLNGHVHQAKQQTRKGVQYLSTPATCIQFKPDTWRFKLDSLPPGYRVLMCDSDIMTNINYVKTNQ